MPIIESNYTRDKTTRLCVEGGDSEEIAVRNDVRGYEQQNDPCGTY